MTWILERVSTLRTTKILPSVSHFGCHSIPTTATTFSSAIPFPLYFFFFFVSISVHLGVQNPMYHYKSIMKSLELVSSYIQIAVSFSANLA